jgi:hypothetical protein
MRKKVGIIPGNNALARTDPTIAIEFISQRAIKDLLYKRYCAFFQELRT